MVTHSNKHISNSGTKARARGWTAAVFTWHNDPVFRSSGWWSVSAPGSSSYPPEPAPGASPAPWELHAQPVSVVVVSIASIDGIVSVPDIIKNKQTCVIRVEMRDWRTSSHEEGTSQGRQPCSSFLTSDNPLYIPANYLSSWLKQPMHTVPHVY